MRSTEPIDHDLPGHGWTVPKLVAYVERLLGHRPSHTKLRNLLKGHGLSACAPWSDRINWHGAYNFSDGQCFIWNEGACNKEHTGVFLARVAEWLGSTQRPVVNVWDGAPWHRATLAQKKAQALGFRLLPLPGYSLDLNPIEGLWKWLREDVTQHYSYSTMRELLDACKAFVDRINLNLDALIKRLWPNFELDPEFEKLLFL